eukprot:577814-Prymnesium_polylepis.2
MLYPVAKPEGLPENETDGEERLQWALALAKKDGAMRRPAAAARWRVGLALRPRSRIRGGPRPA